IAQNGSNATAGSNFGGVQLLTSASDNRFEFNTVAYNHVRLGVLGPGVNCNAPGLVAKNNIITANDINPTFGLTQTAGMCTYGNSYTTPDSQANTLGFVSIATDPPDLHLTGLTPANTVMNVAGSCSDTDIDGQTRPIGGACDLGADEFKP